MPQRKKSSATKKALWWEKGIRFSCQGSGQCCTSHGEYGYVYLTLEDRRRMAKHLKIRTSTFTRTYCDQHDDAFHLKQPDADCLFLKDKRCTIYQGRPEQCRTWPFWPENMGARTWSKEIQTFCPGVGKGKKWTANEIREALRRDPINPFED
jgi:Fe-S-cluster containining protein